MSKAGRPPIPASQRRTVRVGVNLTRAEKARLTAAAKTKSMSLQPWIQHILREAADKALDNPAIS